MEGREPETGNRQRRGQRADCGPVHAQGPHCPDSWPSQLRLKQEREREEACALRPGCRRKACLRAMRPPAPTNEASCAYVLRLQKLHQRSSAAGGFAVQGTLRDLLEALLVNAAGGAGSCNSHLTGGNRGCRSTSHNAQDSCPASTLISFFF